MYPQIPQIHGCADKKRGGEMFLAKMYYAGGYTEMLGGPGGSFQQNFSLFFFLSFLVKRNLTKFHTVRDFLSKNLNLKIKITNDEKPTIIYFILEVRNFR